MTTPTTEEVLKMAKENGIAAFNGVHIVFELSQLKAFAKLVAAKKEKDIIKTIQSLGTWATCEQIEKAIKVRGIK
jgi:hypothetical protein